VVLYIGCAANVWIRKCRGQKEKIDSRIGPEIEEELLRDGEVKVSAASIVNSY
jgi:hypothetical protein